MIGRTLDKVAFDTAVAQLLADDGVIASILPGSLRVEVGGSTVTGAAVVATWVEATTDARVAAAHTRRHVLPPADVARALLAAAPRLPAAP